MNTYARNQHKFVAEKQLSASCGNSNHSLYVWTSTWKIWLWFWIASRW